MAEADSASRVAEVDQGFVLASPDRVFELVRDPFGYPSWWPGVSAKGEGRLRFPEMGTVSVAPDVLKDGIEVLVRVDGPAARGHLQWYLEPFKEGTIVYAITNVKTTKRWGRRRVLRHRAHVRLALLTLKELLA